MALADMAKTGSQWLRRQSRDIYVRRARQGAWRSRAVFKLIDIDKAQRLVRRSDVIVDLGAAPGSWSQYLSQRARRVVACDIRPIEPIDGVCLVQGDFREQAVQQRICAAAEAPLDGLCCDCAPQLSGISEVDQSAMAGLIEETIALANRLVKSGGFALIKALTGKETQALMAQYRARFASLRVVKPSASRAESAETFWLIRLN